MLYTGGAGPGSNKIINELGPRGGIDGLGPQGINGINGFGGRLVGGLLGAGAIGTATTSNTNVYDKSGLKVSPNALAMQPPGNCDPDEQKKMQEEVEGWCKGRQTPTSCKKIESPPIRSALAEVNRQCAMARDKINKQCFAGGDLTHRNQAIDAWKKYSECME